MGYAIEETENEQDIERGIILNIYERVYREDLAISSLLFGIRAWMISCRGSNSNRCSRSMCCSSSCCTVTVVEEEEVGVVVVIHNLVVYALYQLYMGDSFLACLYMRVVNLEETNY